MDLLDSRDHVVLQANVGILVWQVKREIPELRAYQDLRVPPASTEVLA